MSHTLFSKLSLSSRANRIKELEVERDYFRQSSGPASLQRCLGTGLQKCILQANDIPEYDFKMPQSMLIEMFSEIGIPTIDVLPAVLADHRCLYMNDTHWIPEGHELAASAILEELAPILARMKALR